MSPLGTRWLGRVDFGEALALQEEIVRDHARSGDVLLLLEHEPVYTIGRGGRAENLPGQGGRGVPGGAPVPVHRIGRGGDVTYHGPGQLVGYALLDLRARGGDVHRFLRDLESGVIDVLAEYGVRGRRRAGQTGVWVGDDDRPRKIASIGIGVRRGITMHGFALNVSLDLAAFAPIVPCGIAGVEMTSLAAEGVLPVPGVAEVAAVAARRMAIALGGAAPGGEPVMPREAER